MSTSAPSLHKVLVDARWLLTKVQAQEAAAGGLELCASELRSSLQQRPAEDQKLPVQPEDGHDSSVSEDGSDIVENGVAPARPGVGDYYLTEKSRLQQLHKENDDLRQALSEHQHVLEVVMVRYRQQISMLTEARRRDEPTALQARQMQDICRLATQAVGMATAMRQASGVEDELSMREQESLSELQYEHQALRELLETSRPFLTPNQLQMLIDEQVKQRTAAPTS